MQKQKILGVVKEAITEIGHIILCDDCSVKYFPVAATVHTYTGAGPVSGQVGIIGGNDRKDNISARPGSSLVFGRLESVGSSESCSVQ